ncbi:MAG: hypothetical protein IK095_01145, partial [Oscillospiraceae bacterium]|nr:hypothetical protein [Oscillospiraceae bacterium]
PPSRSIYAKMGTFSEVPIFAFQGVLYHVPPGSTGLHTAMRCDRMLRFYESLDRLRRILRAFRRKKYMGRARTQCAGCEEHPARRKTGPRQVETGTVFAETETGTVFVAN